MNFVDKLKYRKKGERWIWTATNNEYIVELTLCGKTRTTTSSGRVIKKIGKNSIYSEGEALNALSIGSQEINSGWVPLINQSKINNTI